MEKMFGWRKRIKWFNWRSDEATRGEESIIGWFYNKV
jgi:hypothetical protein